MNGKNNRGVKAVLFTVNVAYYIHYDLHSCKHPAKHKAMIREPFADCMQEEPLMFKLSLIRNTSRLVVRT